MRGVARISLHDTCHWGEREDAEILKTGGITVSPTISVKDPGNVQVSSLNHISIFTHDANL